MVTEQIIDENLFDKYGYITIPAGFILYHNRVDIFDESLSNYIFCTFDASFGSQKHIYKITLLKSVKCLFMIKDFKRERITCALPTIYNMLYKKNYSDSDNVQLKQTNMKYIVPKFQDKNIDGWITCVEKGDWVEICIFQKNSNTTYTIELMNNPPDNNEIIDHFDKFTIELHTECDFSHLKSYEYYKEYFEGCTYYYPFYQILYQNNKIK